MRLHSLDLQAFGPFATPQQVDFDRLAGGGLFLLEGPTGAGKTTVLDAITFALYGGLAGEDAGEDRLHSHFASPDVEPSVTLEFSLRGTRYRITRVPEHRRPKRRGQGFTTEAMRVHLERRDGTGWASLSSNKAEVGDLIDQVVGLNRTQFTQVMLLPQGEFARFLRSDDDARRAVLTKLFGTELYDQITAELDRRRAEAVRARQAADAEIAAAVSATAEAAGLDAPARGDLIGMAPGPRTAALRQLSDDLAAALARSAADLEHAAAAAKAAHAADQEAAGQAALMTRLTDALTSLRAHEATRAEHDRRSAQLDAARRAEPVRPLLAHAHRGGGRGGQRAGRAARTLWRSSARRHSAACGRACRPARSRRRRGTGPPTQARPRPIKPRPASARRPGLNISRQPRQQFDGREEAVSELGRAAAQAASHVASLTAMRERSARPDHRGRSPACRRQRHGRKRRR